MASVQKLLVGEHTHNGDLISLLSFLESRLKSRKANNEVIKKKVNVQYLESK
jgi:hypothetical protein